MSRDGPKQRQALTFQFMLKNLAKKKIMGIVTCSDVSSIEISDVEISDCKLHLHDRALQLQVSPLHVSQNWR